ncbi:CPXCG motif-containing cysteine-rich protein [Imhoffiella purpurea]|uniref:Restriction endonuclease n=1 Tax=Imhoffiella purpurea TaxID=1249627 RepID=W9V6X3_9GAMM|nr:CPXCG motif-containing cysteine-rich protein [Imhoffiella purpurea]EXJ15164.1 hypothetical protein D779_1718 [Imhoffiella purpurea]
MNPIEPYRSACPWCGVELELSIETGVGNQIYVEDCQVCCSPIQVAVEVDPIGDHLHVELTREGG